MANQLIIGGHVSAAGSLTKAFERAAEIEANCFQIFITPPQQWFQKEFSDSQISDFRKTQEKTQIGPNFIHATYLTNLGSTTPAHLEKSINWLNYSLKVADQLGLAGTIFHIGSHKGIGFDNVKNQVITAIKKILADAPSQPYLILETSAGAGGNIGGNFSQLAELINGVNDPRVKICLDTQHVFASGYELRTKNGVEGMWREFDQLIGLDKLVVCHLNDSKTEFGSGKDRHENIGQGQIGEDGFRHFLTHPAIDNIPLILEVPGDNKQGPNKQSIDLVKALALAK